MAEALICIGCGRERPSEEDIQLSREGLGDPFSPFCWGGIDDRPPCRVSSDPNGRQYITIAESDNILTLVGLAGRIEVSVWPGDPTGHHSDEVRVRVVPMGASALMLSVEVWDALGEERQIVLEAYARGFVDGARQA